MHDFHLAGLFIQNFGHFDVSFATTKPIQVPPVQVFFARSNPNMYDRQMGFGIKWQRWGSFQSSDWINSLLFFQSDAFRIWSHETQHDDQKSGQHIVLRSSFYWRHMSQESWGRHLHWKNDISIIFSAEFWVDNVYYVYNQYYYWWRMMSG